SDGKFTFPADFVIVDFESDHRVPLILGRHFLRTARALIDIHREEMILRDGDERLTLNMRHDTSSYSNQPQKESINMINIFNDSSEDFLENFSARNHQSGNPTFSFHPNLPSQEVKDDIFDPKGGNVLIEKLLNLDSTKIEPDQGELTIVVMKDNLAKPRVHLPNVLTTHPTLMLDSNFIPSDISSPEFETFYFDIKEKNSGNTTIHADIFLLNLECFNFNDKPDSGELTSIVDSGIRENDLSATNVNLLPEEDHSPLFAYVVWIFLSFLTYHVVPLNCLSFRNEDSIFDPSISNYHFPSLFLDVSHRCETFM
nr:reverse transcriptase domain-containing protein [Tanacetum cinerariifolium]